MQSVHPDRHRSIASIDYFLFIYLISLGPLSLDQKLENNHRADKAVVALISPVLRKFTSVKWKIYHLIHGLSNKKYL